MWNPLFFVFWGGICAIAYGAFDAGPAALGCIALIAVVLDIVLDVFVPNRRG